MLDYEIKKLYEDMELYLIQSMKRNFKRHLLEEEAVGFAYPQWQSMKLKELKRYQRENKEIVGYSTKGFDEKVTRHLRDEFEEGSYNVMKDYKEAMGDKYKANKRLNNSFFKTNDKKVNSLIKSVNNDLTNANKAFLRMTNDQYRQVIFKSEFYRANGVLTTKQAIDMANRDFLRRGLNVIEYKDGKRVNIASYSEMAIRTAGQRAMLMGEGEARQKLGTHLIRISTHGTSCELCHGWQGKILIDDVYGGGSKKDGNYTLLSEAMKQGLFHPNCKHGFTTYFDVEDDISDIDEIYEDGKDGSESDAQYQDDLNYINRKIKEYTRLEVGSLDEGNIKTYRTKRKEWQQKKVELEEDTRKYKTINDVFGGGVRLTGIEPEYQQEIKDEFIKIANKYPIDTTYTLLKTNSAKGQLGHNWNTMRAKYDKKTGMYKIEMKDQIALNKDAHVNKVTSTERHNRTKEYFKKPYSGDLSTLWHEYGHQISSKYAIKTNEDITEGLNMQLLHKGFTKSAKDADIRDLFDILQNFNNVLESNKMSITIHEDLFQYLKAKNNAYTLADFAKDKYKYLGKYALDSKEEFFAEGFASINLIPEEEQSEFVKAFAKVFNDEFDRVFRR